MSDKHQWREQMVARYVRGDLDGEELEAFEQDYFENPHVVDMIERERMLTAAMKAASPMATAAAPRWRVAAIAASLLAAALLVGNVVQYQQSERMLIAGGADILPVQSAWLLNQRGASDVVDIDSSGGPLALHVELAGSYAGAVDVALSASDGQPVWAAQNVALDAVGNLTLLLPPPALSQGTLRLQINGGEAAGDGETFYFRVLTE